MSSRRIPDPGSLIAGITFAGIGLIFLIGDANLADRARWVWPIALVGLGAGLLAAVLRGTAERDEDAEGTALEPGPAGDTAADQPAPDEVEPEPEPAEPTTVEDTAVEGAAGEGAAVEDTAVEGGAVEGTVVEERRAQDRPAG